ncbi:hypothetical protein XENOCAPTIV_017254, partial [Xenoophorus captivus]
CAGQKTGDSSWMPWWIWQGNEWRRGSWSPEKQEQAPKHRLRSRDRLGSGDSGWSYTAG